MKLIAIGDIHGRDAWKQVDPTTANRIIFLGDYVDSRQGFTDDAVYENLHRILQFTQANPGKVVLLLGNHDAQYLHYPAYRCGGFRPDAQPELTALFIEHADLFQMAHQHGTYLFTHAGISTGWYETHKVYLEPTDSDTTLADRINDLHHSNLSDLLFEVGPLRGGYDAHGGPAWADRLETQRNYLPGYHQVVGHTPVPAITTVGNEISSITYCDVTQTKAEFYELTL